MTKTQQSIARMKRGTPVTFTNSVGLVRKVGGLKQMPKAVQQEAKRQKMPCGNSLLAAIEDALHAEVDRE